jgi:hypothetical protein
MAEKYSLSWDEFQSSTRTAFRNLLADEDFTDVTLACDDGTVLKTHKIILSSASPLFRSILLHYPHKFPLIFLKGIKSKDLRFIKTFMYLGEVEIPQDDLDGFLKAGKELRIEGLDDVGYSIKMEQHDKETFEFDQPAEEKVDSEKGSQVPRISFDTFESLKTQAIDDSTLLQKYDQIKIGDTNYVKSTNMGAKFSCDKCEYTSKYASHLKRHKDINHEGIKYPCDQCELKLSSKDSLRNHRNYKHEGNIFSCNLCELKVDGQTKLSHHKATAHAFK